MTLTVLIARQASTAVVLQRGPTDWAHIHVWDTSTDQVIAGDRLHARIFPRSRGPMLTSRVGSCTPADQPSCIGTRMANDSWPRCRTAEECDGTVTDLHQLLERWRRRTRAPAMIAAVVGREGQPQVAVLGVCRRDGVGGMATTDDQWHIGSCGKAITSVLYARLVELGLGSWEQPLRSLFPDLADEVDRGWQHASVEQLLQCRAGTAANPPRPAMIASWQDPGEPTQNRTRTVVAALRRKPDRPGHFRYSNLGYVVAGAAIDRLAGMPFEEALSVHVLHPLGITSLGFGPPPRICGHHARLQVGPLVVGKGRVAPPEDPHSDNPALLTPAGRMHLSIGDWARFHQLFLNDGQPLLTSATVDRLLTVPGEGRGVMSMGWAPAKTKGVAYGMQGSNTKWSATALMNDERTHTAMVVANDGRTRVLEGTARLAMKALRLQRPT